MNIGRGVRETIVPLALTIGLTGVCYEIPELVDYLLDVPTEAEQNAQIEYCASALHQGDSATLPEECKGFLFASDTVTVVKVSEDGTVQESETVTYHLPAPETFRSREHDKVITDEQAQNERAIKKRVSGAIGLLMGVFVSWVYLESVRVERAKSKKLEQEATPTSV